MASLNESQTGIQDSLEERMGNRFESKVALVTGGAKGIGRTTAEAFSAEGASVVIADIDTEAGQALAETLPRATFVRTDVASMTDAERAVRTAVETYGGLDILFSNAGIVMYSLIEHVTEAHYEREMGVNFKGHVWMCKYAVPAMRQRGGGAIVCTSSVQALATQTSVAIYAASKAATLALVKAIAQDHAHENIRVNAILPASVDTPMLRNAARSFDPNDVEGVVARWGKMHPIGRVIRPQDVANLVLFLCSDEASALTGGAYLVDGGLMAKLPVVLPE
ncbi:MAG: glucose 1-dehydrogenase [Anaerolineae bacterium]|nr:glucose 1-dehydrogenase [Thermoflexales bacterium]MDW8408231.1 glucose 1-dehydrogenase [Anaerolineae bacterium]